MKKMDFSKKNDFSKKINFQKKFDFPKKNLKFPKNFWLSKNVFDFSWKNQHAKKLTSKHFYTTFWATSLKSQIQTIGWNESIFFWVKKSFFTKRHGWTPETFFSKWHPSSGLFSPIWSTTIQLVITREPNIRFNWKFDSK